MSILSRWIFKKDKGVPIEIKFIYIKNYLHIPRRDKLDFFKLTGKFENFRIANQKVVLSDSSLLIECDQSTNVEKAKEYIDTFFEKKEYQYIETKILQEIILDKDQIRLIFQNKNYESVNIKV